MLALRASVDVDQPVVDNPQAAWIGRGRDSLLWQGCLTYMAYCAPGAGRAGATLDLDPYLRREQTAASPGSGPAASAYLTKALCPQS